MKAILFNKWAETWLESVKGTVKDNTFSATYKNTVENHLVPYFNKKELNNIKQLDIQTYINTIGRKYSLDTVKKNKCCLKKMFEAACDNEICKSSPVRNIVMPSYCEYREMEVYTKQQVELIMKFADFHRFGLEIQMLLETGVRRGELLAVKWSDVDLINRVLHIKRAVADVKDSETGKVCVNVGKPKNKYSIRDIPLSNIMVKHLQNRLHKMDTSCDYVFPNKYGKVCSPRTWSRRHYDVFMRDMHIFYLQRKINIPKYNPHQMRHTRASIWVNDGINLYAIAKVLGHSDLEMLRKRYAHSNIEEIRQLLNIN